MLIYHQPATFAKESCFNGLIRELRADALTYELAWEDLMKRSWTAGHQLRRFGNWYYGSEWNALVPWRDELRLSKETRAAKKSIVHFLWANSHRPESRMVRGAPCGGNISLFDAAVAGRAGSIQVPVIV